MRRDLVIHGYPVNEGFKLDFEYEGPLGSVVFSVLSGWGLREISPPRPLELVCWQRHFEQYRQVKHPIPHQALEDTFVRALENGTSAILDLLVTVHDDYLPKGGQSEDVVTPSAS